MMAAVWSAIWVMPLFALSTMFWGTLSWVIWLFSHDPRKQNWCERTWARSLLWIAGVKVHIEGLEHIQPGGSYVFASNHLSYLDTPVVLGHIPALFRFLAKEELFSWPFMGWHLGRAGHIPVPLEDPRASIRTLTKAAALLQKEKASLHIFPEGGRSETGDLQAFQDGATYLALKGQVPIVPMALIGMRERLAMGDWVFHRGQVTMRISPPIETIGRPISDRTELTKEVRERIVGLLAR